MSVIFDYNTQKYNTQFLSHSSIKQCMNRGLTLTYGMIDSKKKTSATLLLFSVTLSEINQLMNQIKNI